jgi:hypothetical protein
MKIKLFALVFIAINILGFSANYQAQRVVVEAPSLDEVRIRIDHEAHNSGKDMIGVIVEQGFNFFDEASYELMSNGLAVYELEIEATQALGMCVYFDDFHIPVGGELFIESLEGAFDVIFR